ncbi:MAG: aldehyde dehydrogenase [Microthrixaceae bacterium]
MTDYERLYIGGDWVEPAGTDRYLITSPTDGSHVGSTPEGSVGDIDRAVTAARAALEAGPWAGSTAADRAEIMGRMYALLTEQADALANEITAEVGSPLLFSHFGQVGAANMVFEYFTNLASSYEFEEVRQDMLGPALVRKEPVGVVGGIIPWNVPLFITVLKFAPTLVSGSTMVLKPAPETPLSAFRLAEIAHEAGLPAGVLNVVPAGREVGEHLVTHPDVDKISFTGSTVAGRKIASLCGEQLRRCTLELGGKSAAIILDDADLDTIMPELISSATMNNGQACVAQTRILASRKRYNEVVDALTEAMGGLVVGDPASFDTAVGPLIAERQRERVEGYIDIGKNEGARITTGGGRPDGFENGFFVEPTLFADVDNSMRIAQEEIFGPVVVAIPFEDTADALRIANDSNYGLSGSVWCGDVDEGVEVARGVRTGTYSINSYAMAWGAPFGGFKSSGIGRELGPEGLEEFLEFKTINLPAGSEPKLSY